MFVFFMISFLFSLAPPTNLLDLSKSLFCQTTYRLIQSGKSIAQHHTKAVIDRLQKASIIAFDIDDTLVPTFDVLTTDHASVLVQLVDQNYILLFLTASPYEYQSEHGFFLKLHDQIKEQHLEKKCHEKIYFTMLDSSFVFNQDKGFVFWDEYEKIQSSIRTQASVSLQSIHQSLLRIQKKVQYSISPFEISLRLKSRSDSMIEYILSLKHIDPLNVYPHNKIENRNLFHQPIYSFYRPPIFKILDEIYKSVRPFCCYPVTYLQYPMHHNQLHLIWSSFSKAHCFKIIKQVLHLPHHTPIVYFGDNFMDELGVLNDSSMIGLDNITCVLLDSDGGKFWMNDSASICFREKREFWTKQQLSADVLERILIPRGIQLESADSSPAYSPTFFTWKILKKLLRIKSSSFKEGSTNSLDSKQSPSPLPKLKKLNPLKKTPDLKEASHTFSGKKLLPPIIDASLFFNSPPHKKQKKSKKQKNKKQGTLFSFSQLHHKQSLPSISSPSTLSLDNSLSLSDVPFPFCTEVSVRNQNSEERKISFSS